MKKSVITVGPEMTLEEFIHLLDEEGIHGAPVVNDKGIPIGVVSSTDFARVLAEEADEVVPASPFYQGFSEDLQIRDVWPPERGKLDLEKTVREIMSDRVVTATESTSAGALAALMLKEKVHRILITRNQKLVGIVSSTDLLRLVVEHEKNELKV